MINLRVTVSTAIRCCVLLALSLAACEDAPPEPTRTQSLEEYWRSHGGPPEHVGEAVTEGQAPNLRPEDIPTVPALPAVGLGEEIAEEETGASPDTGSDTEPDTDTGSGMDTGSGTHAVTHTDTDTTMQPATGPSMSRPPAPAPDPGTASGG